MRTITIEGLHVLAQVGVLAHEFGAPQPVLISLAVDMPDAPLVPERDEMSQVLDYRHLREMDKAEAEREHPHLLETPAGRIAQRELALPGVAASGYSQRPPWTSLRPRKRCVATRASSTCCFAGEYKKIFSPSTGRKPSCCSVTTTRPPAGTDCAGKVYSPPFWPVTDRI